MNTKVILHELETLADVTIEQRSKRFFKTGEGEYAEDDRFWGIKVPEQRKIAKRFKNLDFNEVQQLIEHPVHEVRLTAVFILVYKTERAEQTVIEDVARFYIKNLPFINSWDIVDSSCQFILGRYLEHRSRDILYDFARSENLWIRRIAMITCNSFIKQNDFKEAFSIAEILIQDQEDIIQKAVGWMLKEIGKKDQFAEENYLKKNNRYKQMPRTMLRYAIEKFEPEVRKAYLNGTI